MSGNSEQEPQLGVFKDIPTHAKTLSLREANMLLHRAAEPGGDFAANFLQDAKKDGWKITFERCGELIVGYSDVIGRMWFDIASECPVTAAYGRLVAHSAGIDLTPDGR